MTSILSYLENMLTYIPAAVIIIIIFRLLRAGKLKKQGMHSGILRELLITLFFVYVTAILSQTVFKDIDTFLQEGHLLVNLTPFNFLGYCGSFEYLVINVLGNIVLFIPAGILIPLLWRGNAFLLSTSGGFLFSLCIEILQLPLYRTTDIDDIMLNTFGAFAGFLIYTVTIRKFPALREKFRVSRKNSQK